MRHTLSALLIVGALLGGCGGEDEPSGGGSQTGIEAYRAELIQLCEETQRESQRIAAGLADPAVLIERLADYARRSNPELEALDPPPSLRDLHARSVRDARESQHLLEDLAREMQAGENVQDAYRRFMDGFRPILRSSRQTYRRMGVPECVEPPAGSLQES